MKCPFCNAPTDVLETRDVTRRRECFNGHRFTTVETLKPPRVRKVSPTQAVTRAISARR